MHILTGSPLMGRILGLTKTRLNRNQLLGVVNGDKKIELVAKGLGQYQKIYYALDVFGKKITFLNSNQIRSVKPELSPGLMLDLALDSP